MVESILNTIKKMLGIPTDDTAFDSEIIVHINSAFMALNQLGVGPVDPFYISDNTIEWTSFTTDINKYEAIKTYIYQCVRINFDPPGTSFHLEALNRSKQELEFRLSVQVPIPPTI